MSKVKIKFEYKICPAGSDEILLTGYTVHACTNLKGKPVKINEIYPENENDKKLFDGALRRRQLRLILAGKMKPEDAGELKSIFN